MKANEYFEKYFKNLQEETTPETFIETFKSNISLMLQEMVGEVPTLIEKRKVSTNAGAVSVVKEVNDKWNSVATKVKNHFSAQFIKRNVIYNLLLVKEFPNEFAPLPEE